MSQPSNVNNILFSNYFETDKICGLWESSIPAADYAAVLGGYLYQYTIPHNFGRPVFCDGLFSTDGTNYFPVAAGTCIALSDSANIYILYNTSPAPTSGSIYYRIVTTWINNYDNTNPLIEFANNATNNSKVAFDSRQNYQKIAYSSMITVNNPGAGNTGLYTVTHNLGYSPNYKLFFESLPGQVWPAIAGGAGDIWDYNSGAQYETYGVSNSSTLDIYYDAGSAPAATTNIWYRIYYD